MQLTPKQVAQFAEDGYLLLRGALTDADLDPIIAEYEEYIGRRAEELLAAGHISALYADEPLTAASSRSAAKTTRSTENSTLCTCAGGPRLNFCATTACSIWSRAWSGRR